MMLLQILEFIWTHKFTYLAIGAWIGFVNFTIEYKKGQDLEALANSIITFVIMVFVWAIVVLFFFTKKIIKTITY